MYSGFSKQKCTLLARGLGGDRRKQICQESAPEISRSLKALDFSDESGGEESEGNCETCQKGKAFRECGASDVLEHVSSWSATA